MNIGLTARKPFYDKFFVNPSMPMYLRLALIDSLSFNGVNNTGGAINNFKDPEFLNLHVNKGLKKYYNDFEDIIEAGNHITNMLTKADLIQIGGAAAIKYCGGPDIDVP